MREFLYVDDLADVLIHLLKYYSDELPLNIGSGKEVLISDLATVISDIIGYNGDIKFDSLKPDGTPRKLLDSTRINNLGWHAQTQLKQGLEKTYKDYLKSIT